MNSKNLLWLKEVIEYFDFYIINNELYMGLHDFEDADLVYRPFQNVVGKNHFDITYQTGDLSKAGCYYSEKDVIKLPRNVESIKNNIFLLYNKEDSNL